MRPHGSSWEEVMSMWLNGNAISHYSARSVGNVLSAYRARPHYHDEVGLSDEDVSDEELIVTSADLANA